MIDAAISSPDPFSTMRHAMVASQLRTTGVSDARVIAAMLRIAREDFVPEDVRATAYRDTALPLGGGRMMNTPAATARLLTQAALADGERVLLIGAARGYAAALVSVLAGAVVAVESDPALAAAARENLAGYARATLVEGALASGAPDHGPFDVLVIDGAVPVVPDALAAQLAPGGRIVTGLADRGVTRLAAGVEVNRRAAVQPFADHDCVVLPGFAVPAGFVF